MKKHLKHILLADDDTDDRLLFEEALDELRLPYKLFTVYDGEQLLHYLRLMRNSLPDLVFIDLNMPKKNGEECLLEIKEDPLLQHLPVIIHSTSFNKRIANRLFLLGARHYIQKPSDFARLKKVLQKVLLFTSDNSTLEVNKNTFIIQP